jgi:hypothetical protein
MTHIDLPYYLLQDLVVYLTVFAALGTAVTLIGLLLWVLRDE